MNNSSCSHFAAGLIVFYSCGHVLAHSYSRSYCLAARSRFKAQRGEVLKGECNYFANKVVQFVSDRISWDYKSSVQTTTTKAYTVQCVKIAFIQSHPSQH